MQIADFKIAPPPLRPALLLALLLTPALSLAQPRETSPLEQARRAADAANRETRHAESAAQQADRRLKRAEDTLRAARVELDTAHREVIATQQRLSMARNAENRTPRDLEVAQKQAR
jgi:hypothetical protein